MPQYMGFQRNWGAIQDMVGDWQPKKRAYYGDDMEEDPLEDLENRLQRAFKHFFDFVEKIDKDNQYLRKQMHELEDQMTNLRRIGDN